MHTSAWAVGLSHLLRGVPRRAADSERGPEQAYLLIGQLDLLALLLEQLEAQSLDSLTAPGAAVLEPLIGMSQPELALLLEQLEAHPLVSLTAPGAAVLEPLIGH